MLKSYAFRNQCYSSKDRKTQNNNLDNQKIDQYYTVTADTPLTAISTSRRPALAIPYVISTQDTAYRHINFLARHSRNPLPPYQLPGVRHWQYLTSYPPKNRLPPNQLPRPAFAKPLTAISTSRRPAFVRPLTAILTSRRPAFEANQVSLYSIQTKV